MDAFGKTLAIENMKALANKWEYFVVTNERDARLKPIDNSVQFNYGEATFFLYDHLGNTRVSYSKLNDGLVVQSLTDYYPYGKILREYVSTRPRYLTTQHERDVETDLDYRGARYYDSEYGRFLSVDPHAVKYLEVSPYCYVLNNPISAIDPNGKDVVFLIAKDGAGGRGHMAILIQDKDGQWYYVTQGGNIPDGTTILEILTNKFEGGYDIHKLNTTDVEVAIAYAKQDTGNSPYTETVQLKTTAEQNEQIFNNSLKLNSDYANGKEKYQLITNNCVDAAQCTVQKGTDIKLPIDLDPRPNKYFEKLKRFVNRSNEKFDQANEEHNRTLTESMKFIPPVVEDNGNEWNIPEQ